jgi:hypothetical protein
MLSSRITLSWRWWHWAIVASALLLASAQAFLLPSWCDEIAYVDPGAQLATIGRMVSTAWVTNSPEALWGSSNPGMPLIFAAWFKLIGFGQAQARLLFCLLHFAGVFFLFRWIRTRLDPTPWALVLGLAASLLLPSLANAIFWARLECLAFLFCAWFLYYAFDEAPGVFRCWVAPLMLGLAIVFFGFHFAGFFAMAAIAVFAVSPNRRTLSQGVGLTLGLVAGLAMLWYVYARIGVWEVFVAARACHYGRVLDWVPLGWERFSVTRDMPGLAVLAGIGLLSAAQASAWRPTRVWSSWLWAFAAFCLIPLLINLVGIYYFSYSWMVALPVMLCFYLGAPSLEGRWRAAFVAILSFVILAAALKFTNRLPEMAKEAGRREQVTATLAAILPKGYSVAADFPLYYQLVGAGYRVFPRVRADEGLCLGFEQENYLPKSVRAQIGCIVTKSEAAPPILSGLGGDWRMVAEIPALPGRRAEENYQIYFRK